MRKLLAILAVALALPTMSFAEGEGRYQMIEVTVIKPTKTTKDFIGVWILDTKTGKLNLCIGGDTTWNVECNITINE